MLIFTALLSAVASACIVLMYGSANATGTSCVWLSAFSALAAFFVRTLLSCRVKPGSPERSSKGRRLNATVGYTLLFASSIYGLKTLGPLRFAVAALCVGGLPHIGRCRQANRLMRFVCVALSCVILVVMPDPAQATPPSFLFGALGLLCTALAVRLAASDMAKSPDASPFLFSAVVLAIVGIVVTIVQKKSAASNELSVLAIFCVATLLFAFCVAGGLSLHANVVSLVSSVLGIMATSLICADRMLPPLRSWESGAALASVLLLLVAHRGLSFVDNSTLSSAPGSFDPAQLFKKTQQSREDGGFFANLMANSRERKLFVFLLLTVAIMFLELLYGIAVNSLGLISDSFHMMLDGTSIAIGLYAAHAASWRPDEKTHPFGYARYEVFGGFVNGILLVFIALYVTVESIQRIIDPPEIEGPYLLLVSVIGLVVNIIGVLFFHDSHGHTHSHSHGECSSMHSDPNMRGVYLHILADMLGSVSVIFSSVVIYFFGFWVADPICSFLCAILILLSAFPLLEETGKVLLLAAPNYNGDYSDELRGVVLETGLLQDVSPPKIWVHSTPPRELTICTVAGKMRSNVDYTTARKKLMDLITSHLARHLDAHNVSVILHLE